MKKLLFSLAAVCLAAFTSAQDAPLWLRHCAISPDGTTIAFTYKGDIYTVPVDGGRAMQLTTNPTVWEAWMFTLFPKREASRAD